MARDAIHLPYCNRLATISPAIGAVIAFDQTSPRNHRDAVSGTFMFTATPPLELLSQPQNSTPQPLWILGTGDFAVEVADWLSDCPGFEVAGFVENRRIERCRETLLDRPIRWVKTLAGIRDKAQLLCALGTTRRGEFIDQALAADCRFTTAVHPTARVSALATLGAGTIVGPGAQIAAATQLGEHVIVNRGALIGHHTRIADLVTIGPGANIGGRTQVGRLAYIAMGAVILNDLTIGQGSVVGAGAVVTKNVPAEAQVQGVPARIVKTSVENR